MLKATLLDFTHLLIKIYKLLDLLFFVKNKNVFTNGDIFIFHTFSMFVAHIRAYMSLELYIFPLTQPNLHKWMMISINRAVNPAQRKS